MKLFAIFSMVTALLGVNKFICKILGDLNKKWVKNIDFYKNFENFERQNF